MVRTTKTNWSILAVLLSVFLILFQAFPVAAADLTSRKVTIGDSVAGATTSNDFNFTIPSFSNIGSIQFEYCSNSPLQADSCIAPTGLSVAGATLSGQTGETGFSILAPVTTNKIILTRTTAAASGVPVTYDFDNIVNPSTPETSVFVRISTYASEDATGASTDFGAVVFSTARNISVAGFVPPYIIFCVGVTVTLNCSSSAGDFLDFGELSTSQTRALTSEYSGSTNDPGGYTTTLTGVTMTSGNNIIPPLTSPTPSQPGQSQFGVNLRDNSSPNVGANPSGPGTSVPAGQVDNPNQYFFNGNQVISASSLSTDFTKFTVSYIVNVSGAQRPGIYNTTMTYIAVAAF